MMTYCLIFWDMDLWNEACWPTTLRNRQGTPWAFASSETFQQTQQLAPPAQSNSCCYGVQDSVPYPLVESVVHSVHTCSLRKPPHLPSPRLLLTTHVSQATIRPDCPDCHPDRNGLASETQALDFPLPSAWAPSNMPLHDARKHCRVTFASGLDRQAQISQLEPNMSRDCSSKAQKRKTGKGNLKRRKAGRKLSRSPFTTPAVGFGARCTAFCTKSQIDKTSNKKSSLWMQMKLLKSESDGSFAKQLEVSRCSLIE